MSVQDFLKNILNSFKQKFDVVLDLEIAQMVNYRVVEFLGLAIYVAYVGIVVKWLARNWRLFDESGRSN